MGGFSSVLRGVRGVLLLAKSNPILILILIAMIVIGGCWHWRRKQQLAEMQQRPPIETISGRQQSDKPQQSDNPVAELV